MSSSKQKLVIVALGGLSGVAGAWTYYRRRDGEGRKSQKQPSKVENLDLNLKQVQVIFRHGARTPLHLIPAIEEATYDKKKWKKSFPPTIYDYEVLNIDGKQAPDSKYEEYYKKLGLLKGGCPHGMLTYLGQVQTYNLGRRLRKYYIGKLPGRLMSEFDPDLVYLRTTNMNRTKDSLRCVLAGVFGAEQLQEHTEKTGQKITFYTATQESEHLFPNPHTCPVLKRINRAAIVDGVDLPEFLEDRQEIEKVLGMSGKDWKSKIHFISARDDLAARAAHGLHIPKVLVPYVTKITENAVQMFSYSFIGQHELQNDIASNLSSGRMLELFRNALRDFISDTRPVRLYLYSAHDSSLMALLLALKLDDKHWPPFASDLLFELYQCNNTKQYYVIVRYNGEAVVLPKLAKKYVSIGQESAVPLKYFMKYLNEEKVMESKEYRKVCESNILDIIAEEIEKREGLAKEEETEAEEMSDNPAGM
ncbi:lysophosphatidic acid phosphatase type 6-like [Saccostrea echinata]|uniref:lysophosphatidic acid phosphatase type 6-like n=1 Tax=Saccostrea echinata TaxID=191078 RepID=UPI002A7F6FC3|nr:lysophosphatidic acid phosphatase type 6-like [Saccostrea echinata]